MATENDGQDPTYGVQEKSSMLHGCFNVSPEISGVTRSQLWTRAAILKGETLPRGRHEWCLSFLMATSHHLSELESTYVIFGYIWCNLIYHILKWQIKKQRSFIPKLSLHRNKSKSTPADGCYKTSALDPQRIQPSSSSQKRGAHEGPPPTGGQQQRCSRGRCPNSTRFTIFYG